YQFDFGAEPVQPTRVSLAARDHDFAWLPNYSFFAAPGSQLALLDKAEPSYQDCKADTRYSGQLQVSQAGTTLCFTGHGVIAAATITKYHLDDSPRYVTLSVVVWRGASQG